MATSPFLRNRQARLAAAAGKAAQAGIPQAPDAATEAGQEYAMQKLRLDDCLRKLADVASHEARLPLKRDYLATFRPWVDGVVEGDAPVQDEILLTSLVWSIDTGDFNRAIDLGTFALKHGQAMPERYNRTVACFLREDIAEAALADPQAVTLDQLARIDELTADADMHDSAKAKLDKALGRAWAAKADAFDPADDATPAGGAAAYLDIALTKLKRALDLDKKAGVKKDIERLESRARKLREENQDDTAGEGSGDDETEQPAGSDAGGQ